MNNYHIVLTSTYSNGRSEYGLIINADSKVEALQLFTQDFEYKDLAESKEDLDITIKVKKI